MDLVLNLCLMSENRAIIFVNFLHFNDGHVDFLCRTIQLTSDNTHNSNLLSVVSKTEATLKY